MSYLNALLSMAAKEFLSHALPDLSTVADAFGNGMTLKRVDFDADFTKVMKKADKDFQESKRPKQMRSFAETKKGQEVIKNSEEKGLDKKAPKKKSKNGKEGDDDG